MYKKLFVAAAVLAVFALPAVASAHVVVKPAEVGVGSFQTFQTGVPNEKDLPVTGVRLVIPAGLNYVSPNVKPGWEIAIAKKGDTVTELNWTGGSIPAGQRDEFAFSAQTPAKPAAINWKAYQTYADGTVVAWDQKPDGKDSEGSTPYSTTKVVNDLTAKPAAATDSDSSNNNGTLGLIFGLLALVISVGNVLIRQKR